MLITHSETTSLRKKKHKGKKEKPAMETWMTSYTKVKVGDKEREESRRQWAVSPSGKNG